jgi:TatD DNase family protein
MSAEAADFKKVLIAAQNNPNIFCTIGIHPDYVDDIPNYAHLLDNPKVVAVGEIGLEYHYDKAPKKRQIESFQKQLEIARRADLPVCVHSREADNDTLEILKNARGVMHCFTGGYEFARAMLDRGFYISASGIITFKNSGAVREVFAKIPLDRILCETDSPYCAPVPYRGRDATPSMVVEAVKCLAEIKKVGQVEMERILWDNAKSCFDRL